jgi:hypothetical protein
MKTQSNHTGSISILKASGERVPFSEEKLRTSLQRSGATDSSIQQVVDEVYGYLQPGITTQQLFKHAFATLKKISKPWAARYKLKQAIMELGPSGFPFEQFIAEVLRTQGYDVQVGVIVNGHCVKHEIDVIATNETEQRMVECKFHNHPGIKCDVKVPLYIHSRFKDVSDTTSNSYAFTSGWVFTNTKFSEDAIQYGKCMGLHLTGWDYPIHFSLRELIDRSGLHPITCLSTLTKLEKSQLLEQEIVHCKELVDTKELLLRMNVGAVRLKAIIAEAVSLTHNLVLTGN